MNPFLAEIAKGGVEGFVGGVGQFLKDVRTAITGKEPITAEQQHAIITQAGVLEQLALQGDLIGQKGQVDLNLADANSGSFFKSGWRPALGWTCVFGLFYEFLLRPLLPWTVQVVSMVAGKNIVLPPMVSLDTSELLGLVFTLLGLGGYRTYEKIKMGRLGK